MQIEITGDNCDITDALKNLIHEKIQILTKHFSQIMRLHVVLSVAKHSKVQTASARMHVPNHDFSATAESHDMYKSIDDLITKLLHQLDKHKEKLTKH